MVALVARDTPTYIVGVVFAELGCQGKRGTVHTFLPAMSATGGHGAPALWSFRLRSTLRRREVLDLSSNGWNYRFVVDPSCQMFAW